MSQLRILADENMRGVEQAFSSMGTLRLMPGRAIAPADLENTDILLVRSVTQVNEELLKNSPVSFVGTATAGFEHIDTGYLAARGIPFATAARANANSVVEYVLSAVAVCGDHLERLLGGGQVGIVGAGHVGSRLARCLDGLGIDYLQSDPWLDSSSLARPATLEEVLGCQVVALHPELTRRQPWPSHHLLAAGQLEQLGDQQLLINASRGAVVDSAALLSRVQQGDHPMLVLDVWEGEPDINGELFQACELGTAHIAGYSLDGKFLATSMLRDALCATLSLEPGQGDSHLTPTRYEIAKAEGPVAALRQLLLAAYDVRDDHQLLAGVLTRGEGAMGFDRLRRDYRERRELRGSRVGGETGSLPAAWLETLGLQPEEGH